MNTWKVILATMVIFGTGVLTGGLLVHKYAVTGHEPSAPISEEHHPAPTAHLSVTNRPAPAAWLRLDFLRRAQRELDLTAEQREQVDKILKESQDQTRKIMEPVQPELREQIRRTKEQFLSVLTPEQRARFDELVRQQHLHEHRPTVPRTDRFPTLTNTQ